MVALPGLGSDPASGTSFWRQTVRPILSHLVGHRKTVNSRNVVQPLHVHRQDHETRSAVLYVHAVVLAIFVAVSGPSWVTEEAPARDIVFLVVAWPLT